MSHHHDIEPAGDSRCKLHHGTVIAVGALPRTHMTTVTRRDRYGYTHTDVQMSQHLEREVWIAAPSAPDRRFVLGEGFGVLPGHELLLACAPGRAAPLQAHNLSTGEFSDAFQSLPYNPFRLIIGALVGGWPVGLFVFAITYLAYAMHSPWAHDPPVQPLLVTAYIVSVLLILLVSTPIAKRSAARRLHARRLIDDRLAAFRARGPRPAPVAARNRTPALKSARRR